MSARRNCAVPISWNKTCPPRQWLIRELTGHGSHAFDVPSDSFAPLANNEEVLMESRRDFLKRAQITLLLVPIAGLAGVACGSSSSGGRSSGCDGPDPTSSVTDGHHPPLCVGS